VSQATFRPVEKSPPRPRIRIPAAVAQAMDRTCQNNEWLEMQADDDDAAAQFIALCRLYARRSGRKVDHEFVILRGVSHLRIRMRPPRPYTKRSEHWRTR
jgi:hypothetical protein